MKFKQTGRRVLTSPMVEVGVILIEGEMFDDGLFRVIAPADTTPEALGALDYAVREFDSMLGRRAWIEGLLSAPNADDENRRTS